MTSVKPLEECDPDTMKRLLVSWHRLMLINELAHYNAAKRYGKYHLILGVPLVILATAVATSFFAELKDGAASSFRIVFGVLSLCAAILAGLQTFLRFSEAAEAHRSSGSRFVAFRLELEQYLAIGPSSGVEFSEGLKSLRNRIEETARVTRPVPQSIWAQAIKQLGGELVAYPDNLVEWARRHSIGAPDLKPA